MNDLSPAAAAVMIAATNGNFNVVDDPVYKQCIAAALKAAAGCVPKEKWGGENYGTGFNDGIAFGCQFLHELAAELEGH